MQNKTAADPGAKKIDWRFIQSFGDKQSVDKISEEDIISTLAFDQSGKNLAIGDRAGRLILFEESSQGKGKLPEYQYLTELQSHVKEFDYLKSVDVEEKLNQVCWLRQQGKNLFLVSTNDKTIKVWKISEKQLKKVQQSGVQNAKDLKVPKMEVVGTEFVPALQKTYPNLHSYLINNISTSYNEEFLLSSDDLRVYLWSLQDNNRTFSVVDLKPDNLEDVTVVITCSKFHPTQDNQFLYSTSNGITKICDMRKTGICDTTGIVLQDAQDAGSKNFFTDIVSSISDACFSKNGRYVYTRDFLTCKVWDLKMTNKPIVTTQIFEPLKSKLCELYENECIFDKFDISSSPDSNYMLTGNFNSCFHVIDRSGDNNLQFQLNFKKKTVVKNIPKKYFENLGSNFDFNMKIMKTAFHPNLNLVAVTCLNTLFFYGQG